MEEALATSALAALLLACVIRAARPGAVLDFLSEQHQHWQIFKPAWLPDKPTGGCLGCTAFWWVGIPAAMLCALFTPPTTHLPAWFWPLECVPVNAWAVLVPFCVFPLVEKLAE